MKEPKFKVVVNVKLRKEESYTFCECKHEGAYKGNYAILFAKGYAEALMYYIPLNFPCRPQCDGYSWWDEDGNDIIKVLDPNGEIYMPAEKEYEPVQNENK